MNTCTDCGKPISNGRTATPLRATRCLICETEELMASQAHPPSEAQQLQDARTAIAQAEAKASHWQQVSDQQRKQIDQLAHANAGLWGRLEALAHIVGTETPIGALDLVTTWQAEKQLYVDQIAELEARLLTYRRQYGLLFDAAVVASGKANELWMGIDPAALDALARCVSSTNAKPEPAQSEETRGDVCPRCGSPGISVISGGISVCTTCLRPGEVEVARARSITQ